MKSGVADGSRRGGYPYLRTSYQHPPGHGIVSADGPEQLRLIPTTWGCAIAILRPRVHGSYAIHFAHPVAPECSALHFAPDHGAHDAHSIDLPNARRSRQSRYAFDKVPRSIRTWPFGASTARRPRSVTYPMGTAGRILRLSDRTPVPDQLSLVDGTFSGYNMTAGSGFENSPMHPAVVRNTTFFLFRSEGVFGVRSIRHRISLIQTLWRDGVRILCQLACQWPFSFPRTRTRDFPTGGHENSPVTAIGFSLRG